MEGWKLKEGILIEKEVFSEELKAIFQNVYASPRQNSYKLFLLKAIIKNILNKKFELSMDNLCNQMAFEYLDFFLKNREKINLEEKKNLLYQLIINSDLNLLERNPHIFLTNDLNFLNKYVFGALFEDTKHIFFGFSKKSKKVFINKSLEKTIGEDKLSELDREILNSYYSGGVEMEENNINKIKYYQQKFSYELNYILNAINDNSVWGSYSEMIKNYSKEEIARKLGIGDPKYSALKQYLEFSGIIENDNFSSLGNKLKKMKMNLDYIEPLIYYNVVRNPENGGHYILSNLINEVIYINYIENYDSNISQSTLVRDAGKLINHSKISDKDWDRMVKSFIGDIADPETGFGKMVLLEQIDDSAKEKAYEIHSYWVEPLVAAYIIYDMWGENQTTMEINKIINSKYNIGRMFLMDEDAVMETLEEIQGLGLITIEVIAGLNQVRINPRKTKEDILDMIVEKA